MVVPSFLKHPFGSNASVVVNGESIVAGHCEIGALPESSSWPVSSLACLTSARWKLRCDVEHEESLLQPIVYLLLRNAAGQVWCYRRSGGDARLKASLRCGVGGHVDLGDAVTTSGLAGTIDVEAALRKALQRELGEELHATASDIAGLRLHGLIYEGLPNIGRVHLGVLYTAEWVGSAPPQPPAGEALHSLGLMPVADIANDPHFELWSRLAVRQLAAQGCL